MNAPVLHTLHGQKLWLSAQRSLFWEEEKTLIVSDLHFGKTGHFRKAGIAVPQSVYKEDLQRLVTLLHFFKPEELMVVGDFFHSHANSELEWFKKWRLDFGQLKVTLVRGNHDILKDHWYQSASIDVVEGYLQRNSFVFSHDQMAVAEGQYNFFGHIHPGVTISGPGRQSLRFPCFYFAPDYCILPAFSKFTGAVAMNRSKSTTVYAIVDQALIKV